jgi:hypothetical protein
MSPYTRADVTVLSQHIAVDTRTGRRHYVVEITPTLSGAVAYPANEHGHIEVRLPATEVFLPSIEVCIDRLLVWIAKGERS